MRFARLLLLFAAIGSLAGCATFQVLVPTIEHEPANASEELHYLLIKRKGGKQTVYDCYSRPGGDWAPECKRVRI